MKSIHDWFWLVGCVAVLTPLGGCNQGARSLMLDQDVARQSLETFLKSWQEGKAPADLKNATPAIIVGDADWEAGKKLVEYKRLPEEKSDGTNLHMVAELTLRRADGNLSKRKINYVVGTSPVITIFRP
jgi:hypothetical protein